MELNWYAEKETLLRKACEEINAILNGTTFTALRNTTVGEKCVNIMQEGVKGYVGHIWPKIKNHEFDVCLTNELAQNAERFLGPELIGKERDYGLPNFKKYRVNEELLEKIMKAVALH